MRNLIKKILKESEDDFGWTDELLNYDIDKPKQVWVNNKRYALIPEETGNGWSSNGFRTTNWSGWFNVSDITQHNGELCYVVNFSDTYPRAYMPIRDFRPSHVRY